VPRSLPDRTPTVVVRDLTATLKLSLDEGVGLRRARNIYAPGETIGESYAASLLRLNPIGRLGVLDIVRYSVGQRRKNNSHTVSEWCE
jgi:hypothetical protein